MVEAALDTQRPQDDTFPLVVIKTLLYDSKYYRDLKQKTFWNNKPVIVKRWI